jgi:UDP-GlcNAc3NAcA epimerase
MVINKMKIVTVIGARPQFIKAAVFSRAVFEWNKKQSDEKVQEVIVHTGQHYDHNMSQVFFDELGIPKPDYDLGIGGGTHGAATGAMLEKVEKVLQEEKPDWLLVYGDTNSTLVGSLAAAKLHIKVVHIEAGLRSFNKRMPEEINRILTDHLSDVSFCPTDTAVKHLESEGIKKGVFNVGDVMFDASLFYRHKADEDSNILSQLGITTKKYVLTTCHRAENTDCDVRLAGIVDGLNKIAENYNVILPLHPRTKLSLEKYKLIEKLENVKIIQPVAFLDMIKLEENASLIITDSGGVQKEAYFFKVPCVTLRDETEWTETVNAGWNTLVGADSNAIQEAFNNRKMNHDWVNLYGNGDAGNKILDKLIELHND